MAEEEKKEQSQEGSQEKGVHTGRIGTDSIPKILKGREGSLVRMIARCPQCVMKLTEFF